MVTDQQVRLLRQKRMEGRSQEAAAAAAGMSPRTARKWETGPLPSNAKRRRTWRTRRDPFEGVWTEEILPLLERDTERVLQATTLLDLLEGRYPGRFGVGQLRTLQRRIRDRRAGRPRSTSPMVPSSGSRSRGRLSIICCSSSF